MKIFVFLLLFYTPFSFCQNAKTEGASNAFTAIKNKYIISTPNPASIIENKSRFISINAAPMLFGVKELAKYSIGYLEPFEIGNFSLNVSSFGFDLYKIYAPEITYAKKLYEIFSAGIRVRYEYLNIRNYGADGALGIDLGGIIDLDEQLSCGFCITNINSPKIGSAKEGLEQCLRLGLAWRPVKNFTLGMDINKDLDLPAAVLFGFDYSIISNIDIRAGISAYPSSYSAGLSFYYSGFNFDYALSQHNELGSTHFIGLNILLDGSVF